VSSRLLTVRRPTGGDVNALLPAGDLATGRRAGAALVRHLRHGALWAARLWPRALGSARWRSRWAVRIGGRAASTTRVHLAEPCTCRQHRRRRCANGLHRVATEWCVARSILRGAAHRETPHRARHAPAPDTAASAMGLARLVLPPSRATPQVAVSERPRPDDRDLGKCPVDDGGFLRHSSTRQFDRGSTTRHPRSLREFLRTP
jgi:hypothetical protein